MNQNGHNLFDDKQEKIINAQQADFIVDISKCKVSRDGCKAECLVEKDCRWAITFLGQKFCSNPDVRDIAPD